MIRYVVACLAALALAGTASAQIYTTQPDGTGGWNTYGPGGVTTTRPNGSGGWVTNVPQTPPPAPYVNRDYMNGGCGIYRCR